MARLETTAETLAQRMGRVEQTSGEEVGSRFDELPSFDETIPDLTDDELVEMTTTEGVTPDTLRLIGNNLAWASRYPVAKALVLNPKTPPEISMKLVDRLEQPDLENLESDQRLPKVLRDQARSLMGPQP